MMRTGPGGRRARLTHPLLRPQLRAPSLGATPAPLRDARALRDACAAAQHAARATPALAALLATLGPILPVAFGGYLVGGIGHGVKNVLLRSLLTVRVSEAVRGRAFAAYNAARSMAELGAVGAGGVLVSALGPRAALLLAGLGPIVAALAGLTALRRRRVGETPLVASPGRWSSASTQPSTEPGSRGW